MTTHDRPIDVLVLGGGISGLTAAHYLRGAGLSVALWESGDRVGGVIRSERQNGFLIEHGPNSTLDTTPLLRQLAREMHVIDRLIEANGEANNRYILRDGELRALPMSPPAFIRTPLFSAKAKLRLFAEPFIKPYRGTAPETLADFVLRRLGREFLDYAINPFVAGVYAGDPHRLEVSSAFPKLHALEQSYGSLIKGTIKGRKARKERAETSKQSAKMISFRDGLQTLTDAIGARLGDAVRTGVTVTRIERADEAWRVRATIAGEAVDLTARAVLSTIPAHAVAELPFDFDLPVSADLAAITYPPVTMVYTGYRGNPAGRPVDGFGYLIPEKEKRSILGTIWSSTVFTDRAPEGGVALTTFVGGMRQPEIAQLPADALLERVMAELRDLMGITVEPDTVMIRPWPRAIPQYQPGHAAMVDRLAAAEFELPGLYFSGNYRGGISVADCVKQSHAMSERIAAELAERPVEAQQRAG